MAIRISKELRDQFRDIELSMRQWPTWKLKCREFGLDGKDRSSWDGMSVNNKKYNVVFNQLTGIIREFNYKQLTAVLRAAEQIAKEEENATT